MNNLFVEKKRNQHFITHGGTGTRLHRIWKAMKTRCSNPNIQMAHIYTGKGVTLCEEWNEFVPFRDWALSNGYRDNLSIDRIDNDGNYEPSNCRWATRVQQQNNTSTNVNLEYNGQVNSLSEWGRILNIESATLSARYTRGYSTEQILGVKPLVYDLKPTIPVIQLSLDGEYIREFPSIVSAKRELNTHHISDCCKGKRNSSGGYKWVYKSEYKGSDIIG